MHPHELQPERLKLPDGDRFSAVLFTGGDSLRFLRFSYRFQQAFPGLVRKWYVHTPARSDKGDAGIRGYAREIVRSIRHRNRAELARLAWKLRNRILSDPLGDRAAAERALFAEEVRDLKQFAAVGPTPINDPNAPEVIGEIAADLSPYFMLSLGGPLYRKRLFNAFRGPAINQHAGWSPELRGSGTIVQALYHRRTDWLGSTVHLLDTGADSGPILRRSMVTVMASDKPAEIFMRTVALGTELMIEAVSEILETGEATIFRQPLHGRTLTTLDQSPQISAAVARDLRNGWLAGALARERSF